MAIEFGRSNLGVDLPSQSIHPKSPILSAIDRLRNYCKDDVGILPDRYLHTNQLPQIPTKHSVPKKQRTLTSLLQNPNSDSYVT